MKPTMDHSDERRRLINLRANLDSAIRSVGDGADAAMLLHMPTEENDLRHVQYNLTLVLKVVEKRIDQ
jgi:hypothetical protein